MLSLSLFISLLTASVVSSQTLHDGYIQKFSNLTGATEAPDYLTFELKDTLDDCLNFCNSVKGCNFVNFYHDVHGKRFSRVPTCSLYQYCHDNSTATNYGGQLSADERLNYITNSDGWCKIH